MVISDTLPGTVPDQQLQDSGEGLHPVPGERLQYGLDLTLFMAIIDNPEPMTYGRTSASGGSEDSDRLSGNSGPGLPRLLRGRHPG